MTAPSGIVLHHLRDSRSQRILWLLEELEVPYDIKIYDRKPSQEAPAELRQIHPLGKSPILTDGNVALAESGAIVEYLITKYGKGRFQPSEEGWLDNLYYTHYAEGTLMPLFVWKLILSLVPGHTPFFIRPFVRFLCSMIIASVITKNLDKNVEMIDQHLQKHPGKWIAGGDEPTSADFSMMFPIEIMSSKDDAIRNPKESIYAYATRLHDRPAYKRALEKGGRYAYAKL